MKTAILAGTYGIVQTSTFFEEGLSNEAKLLYCYLASLTGNSEELWPTFEDMNEALGGQCKDICVPLNELLDREMIGLYDEGVRAKYLFEES